MRPPRGAGVQIWGSHIFAFIHYAVRLGGSVKVGSELDNPGVPSLFCKYGWMVRNAIVERLSASWVCVGGLCMLDWGQSILEAES